MPRRYRHCLIETPRPVGGHKWNSQYCCSLGGGSSSEALGNGLALKCCILWLFPQPHHKSFLLSTPLRIPSARFLQYGFVLPPGDMLSPLHPFCCGYNIRCNIRFHSTVPPFLYCTWLSKHPSSWKGQKTFSKLYFQISQISFMILMIPGQHHR